MSSAGCGEECVSFMYAAGVFNSGWLGERCLFMVVPLLTHAWSDISASLKEACCHKLGDALNNALRPESLSLNPNSSTSILLCKFAVRQIHDILTLIHSRLATESRDYNVTSWVVYFYNDVQTGESRRIDKCRINRRLFRKFLLGRTVPMGHKYVNTPTLWVFVSFSVQTQQSCSGYQ